MSASPKKIVVFTATGDQGGSVCSSLIEAGGYEVVGLTRNPESEKAKELSALGVKMVSGNMEDVSSYAAHLEGLHGAFVNADFWARYFSNGMNGPEAGEFECGISSRAIEACATAGAKHIVYSSLDDGEGLCPHIDSKQRVSQWAKSKGYPVTDLYTSHYISNLSKFDYLKPLPDGSYMLGVPAPDDCVLANYDPAQTGGWVVPAFQNPSKYIGAEIKACSEEITVADWAKLISELIDKPVKTMGIPASALESREDLMKQGIPEEVLLNFLIFSKGMIHRDINQSRGINPAQKDTRQWIKDNNYKAFLANPPSAPGAH